MSGVPTVSAPIAPGSPASDVTIDQRMILVGPTSLGSGVSSFFRSSADLVAARGKGDVIDTATNVIEQQQEGGGNGIKVPVAVCTVPATNAGTYGTIDTSGITGTSTAAIDPMALPLTTADAWLLVAKGGTVGTAGIQVKSSLDGARTAYGNAVALGTDTGFAFANGARIEFSPANSDLTALNALLNEIKTDVNAHVIVTAGTVHTNSGVADVVATANATNTATRIALANALRLAASSHFGKGSGAVPAIHINVGGNAAGVTALGLIPVATDDDGARFTALALKSALNTHVASTVFHTIADATNVVTSASPAAGTLNTGDLIKVRTNAPTPDPADIYDGSTSPPTGAMALLGNSAQAFSMVAFDFPCDSTMQATITQGLNYMESRGKDVACVIRTRIPDEGESETGWATSVADDFRTVFDYRITRRAGYGLVTDALTGRRYFRSTFVALVASLVRVPLVIWANSPSDRPQDGVRLSEDDGADVGHDEGARGTSAVLSDETLGNLFSCDFRSSRAANPESAFGSFPFTAAGPTQAIKSLPLLRVIYAVRREALRAAFTETGGIVAFNSADPTVFGSVPTLPQATRLGLQGAILRRLSARFQGVIQNPDDTDIESGLVRIPTVATVSQSLMVSIAGALSVRAFGYLINVSLPISIQGVSS